ncbi:MAG: hypothetical protein H0X17_14900, partial [Deltaproteobacteria bacterium]|nr:hypothetical protein [Deltaproteobacteria bacterium]
MTQRAGRAAGLGFLVGMIAASGPAAAQSRRYPPEPVDKDEELARQSELWNHATNPRQAPYLALVKDAQKLLAERRSEATVEAVKKLDAAVKLMPNDAEAYRTRGDAHVLLLDWSKCSADYDAAWTRLRKEVDVKQTSELRRKLGLCLARSGKLAEAERVLAEAAATGINSVEIWMRLGEVRIAMGKLEEAIAALESSIEQTDIPQQALVRWLLAGAFDRARRPSEAVDAARRALASDRNLTTLKNPTLPLLGPAEADYLLGLAYEAHDPQRPELALIYFRRFLRSATDSPWRRRAEDHVKELKTAQLPDAVERASGNAALDEKLAR